jgi:hypothetical protein
MKKNNATLSLTTLLTLSLATLGGCAFVNLTDAGSQVRQATATEVVNCKLVGEVSSQTKDKIVFNRNTGNVKEELIVLARNKAAELDANAIVTDGKPYYGAQNFKAYRCEG